VYHRFCTEPVPDPEGALLTDLLSDLAADQTFTALDGVSFEIAKGHVWRDRQGSGTVHTLKLLAGITKPTGPAGGS
jgi:ABC-type uncharacterized transport system ATPase subunit